MSQSLPIVEERATNGGAATALDLDPRTYDRALSCVHCGLCLPACPTYVATGHEADSPRGRIQLMRGLAEGAISPTDTVLNHLDLCLDCRGCETACPSGVVYHELIEETRAKLRNHAKPTLTSRALASLFTHVFTHPTRLKLALLPARLMQKVGVYSLLRKSGAMRMLPSQFQKMEQMLPAKGPLWPKALAEHLPARKGETARARVAFLQGCIGSVMFSTVNRQAMELLAACGAEVLSPRTQSCCGAIHHHNGIWDPARELARNNIEALLPKKGPAPDYITSTIAGCGSMLHEYDHLLRDDPGYAERAKEFAGRAKDIVEVLALLGVEKLLKHPVEQTATYHEACHLVHAQKVSATPKRLLSLIPRLKLVALPEADLCCGAAGTYNLTQPEMASQLAGRKLENIASTHAPLCVTGNVGCAMHIQSQAEANRQALMVVHPVTLLHQSVFGGT